MNRRVFLGSVGTVLSAGLLGRRAFASDDGLTVRVWTSEAAARYDELPVRVRGYLRAALEPLVGALEVEFVDEPVSLPREGGRRVLGTRWPRMVVEGTVGFRRIEPVNGVNLLVTDGDPTRQPAGFARPQIAATTGASALVRMGPAEETPPVVDNSVPAAATQLLLHECGHAIGLTHDHGSAVRTEDGVEVSPMVGSYLWADADVRDQKIGSGNVCGDGYAGDPGSGERRLRLRYADCASQAIRR